jgi:CRP/FNR family transcriptional regulator, cyclic AMP receptor protein
MSTDGHHDAKLRIVDHNMLSRGTLPETREALAASGVIQRVPRHEQLLRRDQTAAAIALVGTGDVRLYSLRFSPIQAMGYRTAGEVVGEGALGGEVLREQRAVAMTDVEALRVPREAVTELLTRDPALCAAVLKLLVTRRREAEEHAVALLRSPVMARLSAFLLAASHRWGQPEPRGVRIAAPVTHAEIASVIGSTRETVTLSLGMLRREGVIDFDGRQVIILRRESLEARADATPGARVVE